MGVLVPLQNLHVFPCSLDEHHSLRYVPFSHNASENKHKGKHKEKENCFHGKIEPLVLASKYACACACVPSENQA